MISYLKTKFIGLFFSPDAHDRGHPRDVGIDTEDIKFISAGQRQLHGFFMKPSQPALGTVIHCHGNGGNVTCHYEYSDFFVHAGYNVFCFDYGGYGQSEGHPNPHTIIEDAMAAVQYVKTRSDVDPQKIILFGQSLGGAAATAAMVKDKDVRCLILEGTFTSYRDQAFATLTGKFLFFLTPIVILNEGPVHDIAHVAPRPVLIVHGDRDGLIPVRFAHRLFAAAKEKKSLSILNGFRHLQGSEEHADYTQSIINFLKNNI